MAMRAAERCRQAAHREAPAAHNVLDALLHQRQVRGRQHLRLDLLPAGQRHHLKVLKAGAKGQRGGREERGLSALRCAVRHSGLPTNPSQR